MNNSTSLRFLLGGGEGGGGLGGGGEGGGGFGGGGPEFVQQLVEAWYFIYTDVSQPFPFVNRHIKTVLGVYCL